MTTAIAPRVGETYTGWDITYSEYTEGVVTAIKYLEDDEGTTIDTIYISVDGEIISVI